MNAFMSFFFLQIHRLGKNNLCEIVSSMVSVVHANEQKNKKNVKKSERMRQNGYYLLWIEWQFLSRTRDHNGIVQIFEFKCSFGFAVNSNTTALNGTKMGICKKHSMQATTTRTKRKNPDADVVEWSTDNKERFFNVCDIGQCLKSQRKQRKREKNRETNHLS